MFPLLRQTRLAAWSPLVIPVMAMAGLLGVFIVFTAPVHGFVPSAGVIGSTHAIPAPETPVAVPGEDVPVGTSEDVLHDPLSHEEPGEPVPDVDVTVPPPDDGTEEIRKPPEILWSNVRQAERKLDQLHEERLETLTAARVLRKRRKELTVASQQLDAESAETVAELAAALDRLQTRAVLGFQQFGSGSESEESVDFSDYKEVVDDQRRSRMVDSALKFDGGDIDRLDELRGRLSSDGRAVLDRISVVSQHLNETEAQVVEIDIAIDDATIEYEAFRAGSQIFIHGVVFPVAPGYTTPLIDSWGFPRMVGTEDEHGHEGIDIFAPRGTPLVAAERGVIARVGSGRLGGLKFWLHGESGTKWYYAHLDSFAPALVNGAVVESGMLLGYVGDTGNAVGTPPHLHLQVHPGGGDPINPYPLLKVVSDLDQAAMAAGTFRGYEYEAVVADRPDPEPEPVPEPEPAPDSQPEPEPASEQEPAPELEPLEEVVETPIAAVKEQQAPQAQEGPPTPTESQVPEPETP